MLGLFGQLAVTGGLLLALVLLVSTGVAAGSAELPPGKRQVQDTVAIYRDKAEQRLFPRFRFAGVEWPPQEVALLAIKDIRRLELWARSDAEWRHIHDYRIKGMSGGPGPKLREGDEQVPEGSYRIEALNANSAFHLSMKIDYPNDYDRRQALRDGRSHLGDDIFIHGKNVSKGCLAIGDNAIEELFVLAALTGLDRVRVLIARRDFRLHPPDDVAVRPPDWLPALEQDIAGEMARFPLGRK